MLTAAMKKKLMEILMDDIGRGDITSALLPLGQCRGAIIAKESCIIAGLEEAKFLFNYRRVNAVLKAKDGSAIRKGQTVMLLNGENRYVLEVERTALNVIGRMSAVATACSTAKRIVGKKTTIALTRKTMPGFNLFDKKAALLVGVWPHRINLNEAVLIKDDHLAFFASPSKAVEKAKEHYGNGRTIEIEVQSLKQALDAAKARPDIIMLDNFSPAQAKRAVKILRKNGFRGKTELSGGITLKNLGQYAKCGADIISMGSLTQAVASKNFSLEIVK